MLANPIHVPAGVAPPVAQYSHVVEVRPLSRLVFIAGQTGTYPDGTVALGIEAQAEQVFGNITAALTAAGLDPGHLVKTTILVTDRAFMPAVAAARARAFGPADPASTMMVVAGLADPAYLVEIEAVAAELPNHGDT